MRETQRYLTEKEAEEKEWLSVSEVAELIGISERGVRKRISTGKLEAFLVKGRYYMESTQFARQTLQECIEMMRRLVERESDYLEESIVEYDEMERTNADIMKLLNKRRHIEHLKSSLDSDRGYLERLLERAKEIPGDSIGKHLWYLVELADGTS